MVYDISKLVIAGAADVSEWNAPDVVFAYFTDAPLTPRHFDGIMAYDSADCISVGDLVLAGPQGSDGRIDMDHTHTYTVRGGDVPLLIDSSTWKYYSWLEHLATYRPFQELHDYRRDIRQRWHSGLLNTETLMRK